MFVIELDVGILFVIELHIGILLFLEITVFCEYTKIFKLWSGGRSPKTGSSGGFGGGLCPAVGPNR